MEKKEHGKDKRNQKSLVRKRGQNIFRSSNFQDGRCIKKNKFQESNRTNSVSMRTEAGDKF